MQNELPPVMFFKYLAKNFFVLYTTHYVATQQFNLKENTMFGYTEVEKKYKEFEAQVKQIQEFWIDAVITSLKALQK